MSYSESEFSLRYAGSGATTPHRRLNDNLSAEIAKQTKAFLRKGGTIQRLPIRIGNVPTQLNNAAGDDDAKKKQRARNSAARATQINRVSSKLWMKNAADRCNIPLKEFQAMVDRREGPPYTITERGHRMQFEIGALDTWDRNRPK